MDTVVEIFKSKEEGDIGRCSIVTYIRNIDPCVFYKMFTEWLRTCPENTNGKIYPTFNEKGEMLQVIDFKAVPPSPKGEGIPA